MESSDAVGDAYVVGELAGFGGQRALSALLAS